MAPLCYLRYISHPELKASTTSHALSPCKSALLLHIRVSLGILGRRQQAVLPLKKPSKCF